MLPVEKVENYYLDGMNKDKLFELTEERLLVFVEERKIYCTNKTKDAMVDKLLTWKKQQEEKNNFLNANLSVKGELYFLKTQFNFELTECINLEDCQVKGRIQPKTTTDHIVELQLIRDFTNTRCTNLLPQFIIAMNTSKNLQEITVNENIEKGMIIRTLITARRNNVQPVLTETHLKKWKEYKTKMERIIMRSNSDHLYRHDFAHYLDVLYR